ncbi:MAG: hypothetical protein AAGC59_14690, partial [Brucella pseudogrignonensis]
VLHLPLNHDGWAAFCVSFFFRYLSGTERPLAIDFTITPVEPKTGKAKGSKKTDGTSTPPKRDSVVS